MVKFPTFIFKLRTPFNFVLLNMVVNEMLIASIGLPFDFTAAYNQGWVLGRIECQFVGFTHTLTGKSIET
jgi:hypothetical protein